MAQSNRIGQVQRKTKETDINITLNIDGRGQTDIHTGVGFLDHMLILAGVHGFFDLQIIAHGDTEIDDHHTVEDIGISMGQALKSALGDSKGIKRYGSAYVPMDETLARVCLDISNRPHLHYNVTVPDQKVGQFDTALAKEFFRAISLHGGLTLHIDILHGENSHHILEAIFKAFARALDQATMKDQRVQGQLSSKGML